MPNINLAFSVIFVVALVGMVGTKLWLASRQIRHVAANRLSVPSQFLQSIPLAAHQRAADYTVERTRLTMIEVVIGAALLFNACFILISGIQIVTSRLLDSRKTFIVGLALVLSISRDVFPG